MRPTLRDTMLLLIGVAVAIPATLVAAGMQETKYTTDLRVMIDGLDQLTPVTKEALHFQSGFSVGQYQAVMRAAMIIMARNMETVAVELPEDLWPEDEWPGGDLTREDESEGESEGEVTAISHQPEDQLTPDHPAVVANRAPVANGRTERVKPVASRLTPINWAALTGADPQCLQLLMHNPPGTKVPLFPGADRASQFKQQNSGFTTDHRGVGFDRFGQPVPESLVYAGYQATAAARTLSNSVREINDEFCSIQANSAAYRDRVNDGAFQNWSNYMLNLGRFVHQGEEYEVDNQYVYAVGSDDYIYRAEHEGHFDEGFKIVRLR
ncbi:MAG: hypothetical protein HQ582_34860 [Planctomycetes bacterium]|nr:hypothetical protein [Planctomycetota bacterium]